MKRLSAALVVGGLVLGMTGIANAVLTVQTTVYPKYVDNRADGFSAPFAVYVEISDATADHVVRVRTSTTGTHLTIWDGTTWGSAHTYDSAPEFTIGADGTWSGWIYVRGDESTGDLKTFVKDMNTETTYPEATTHPITYLDMSTSGATIHDVNNGAPNGYAVVAFAGNDIVGIYAAEINGVIEGYPDESSYFKMAIPSGVEITKFEARDSNNNIYYTDEDSDDATLGDQPWGPYDAGSSDNDLATTDLTLPVTLSSFTALPGDGQIVLRWITESEMDNLGFNVYRSLEEDGEYRRINGDLIQGAGSSAGRNAYSFTDVRLTNGRTYFYKLEDVSFDGKHTLHGPIKAIPKAAVKGEEKTSGEEWPKRSHWGKVKHSLRLGDAKDE